MQALLVTFLRHTKYALVKFFMNLLWGKKKKEERKKEKESFLLFYRGDTRTLYKIYTGTTN